MTWPRSLYDHIVTLSSVRQFFSLLKKTLKGHCFYLDSEIIDNVQNWFQSQSKDFYEQGIHHLVNSGTSARVVLEIIFEINYLISFMWLLFCFHLIQPNDLGMKIFIYKNSKSDKYITEANR